MQLTSEQREALQELLRNPALDAERQRNARLLLMYDEGRVTREIAAEVGLSESRTRYWRKQFERSGMHMFDEDYVPPRRAGTGKAKQTHEPLLTSEQQEHLRALRAGDIDDDIARRVDILLSYADGKETRSIAEEVGLSPSRTRYWRKAFERDGMSIIAETSPSVPENAPERAGSQNAAASAGSQNAATETKKKKKLPGLQRFDSFSEAGRKVLRLHFEEMLAHGGSEALGEDIEIVHRMRVATRRMRSAFDVFDGAFTEKTVRRFRKPLKRTGKVLGSVRDLDVLLEHMRTYAATLKENDAAAFRPLLHAWEEERQRHLATLRSYLDSDAYRDFCREFAAFAETPGKGTVEQTEIVAGVQKRIVHIAPVLIMERLTDILAFDHELGTASLDRLHALRIQCKKLRYTMEFLQELLGNDVKKLIKHVTDMQDYLGHLQDDQTAGQMITAFVQDLDQRQSELPFAERLNAAPLLTYLADRQARKHDLLTNFPAAWEDFLARDFRSKLLKALLAL
ncbi:CHAD domain-containing protein [bacterium]|nr:CHAD domain-containing protein [bacterium]